MQPEIRLAIENEKRRAALQSLTADLLRRAKIVRLLQASTWNSQTSALPPGVFARSLTFAEVSTSRPARLTSYVRPNSKNYWSNRPRNYRPRGEREPAPKRISGFRVEPHAASRSKFCRFAGGTGRAL